MNESGFDAAAAAAAAAPASANSDRDLDYLRSCFGRWRRPSLRNDPCRYLVSAVVCRRLENVIFEIDDRQESCLEQPGRLDRSAAASAADMDSHWK